MFVTTHLIKSFIWLFHTDLKDSFGTKVFSELVLLDLKCKDNRVYLEFVGDIVSMHIWLHV